MTVNEWFEHNYKNIAKISKYYTTDKTLITHYYLWLIKHPNRWEKMSEMTSVERMKFTNTWLRNNNGWENSDYSKDKRVNNFGEIWDDEYTIEVEYENPLSIEIGSENTSDDIKEWLIDIESNFGENADKIILLRKIYLSKNFHTTDRVLYDMYFTDMMSYRDISKKLNIPLSSIHLLVNELKNKIKEKCGLTSSITC